MNATAEAVNWALERAATLAAESCECGVGSKLAEAIRGLKVEHASIEIGSTEEMEELDAIEHFQNVRVQESGTLAVATEGEARIRSNDFAHLALALHRCDRKGPMIPINGGYRFSCSTCGQSS